MLNQPMRRQVLRLATAQALFQTASVLVMTVGALAGAQIASPEWATAPIAAMFLGTALTTFPASMWMARVGRRAGFITGALLGTLAGLVAAAGIWLGSLALLALGTLLVGAYQGFAQFYRFAAGEVADEAYRPRAIALVLGGGIVAARGFTLLTTSYHPVEKGRAQAINDMTVFVVGLVCSLGAGALLEAVGWQRLNLLLLPWLALAVGAVLWFGAYRRCVGPVVLPAGD